MENFLELHIKGKLCVIKKDLIVAVAPFGDSGKSEIHINNEGIANEFIVDETSEEIWKLINSEE